MTCVPQRVPELSIVWTPRPHLILIYAGVTESLYNAPTTNLRSLNVCELYALRSTYPPVQLSDLTVPHLGIEPRHPLALLSPMVMTAKPKLRN